MTEFDTDNHFLVSFYLQIEKNLLIISKEDLV